MSHLEKQQDGPITFHSRYYPDTNSLFWEHQRWCMGSWPSVGSGFIIFVLVMILEQQIDLGGAIFAFLLAYGGMSVYAWYRMHNTTASITFHSYGITLHDVWNTLTGSGEESILTVTRTHYKEDTLTLDMIGYSITLHRKDWPDFDTIRRKANSIQLLNVYPLMSKEK